MSRVCVVGAGAAGLCAARHLLVEPCVGAVDVLEQAAQVGGTWVYTEHTGYDDFGLPIHTSMYKSLRTNLPKEIMGFPDFPIPESDKSYLPAKDMFAFLQLYADKHGVTEHIKFRHHVQLIKPRETSSGEVWDVTYKSLETGVAETKEYDYVFVCNGHYNTPFIPNIPGLKEFQGDVMHSHDYRVPDIFSNKRVLVVGAGPSGMDIALEVTSVATHVTLSHHLKEQPRTVFPENLTQRPDVERLEGRTVVYVDGSSEEVDVVFLCTVPSGMDIATSVATHVTLSHHLKEQPRTVFPENLTQKPDVERLEGRTVVYVDGSTEEVDVVFLCTGYLYNFPFLHPSCGVCVDDNCVEPLYKHLVNIRHPSMCFIGVPYYVCAFSMFDLQVRYYVRSMNGTFKLPSQQAMTQHWEEEKLDRAARGYTKRQTHMMGPDQEKYYASLATEARTQNLPSVITKIREESSNRFLHNLRSYRQDIYKIIDDETYEIISNGRSEILC